MSASSLRTLRFRDPSERLARVVAGALALLALTACADAPRPIFEDPDAGFALYRSGRLSPADLGGLCELGVEEILVLDGDGENRECVYRDELCPTLTVRYNHEQEADRPVSTEFLAAFDAWIEEAQTQGKKIAFRCRHGWHRTGRLAAYYRLRFEGASIDEVREEMHRIGRLMWLHPTLDDQVEAYADLLASEPCSVDPESCPTSDPDPGLLSQRFQGDLCTTEALAPAPSAGDR